MKCSYLIISVTERSDVQRASENQYPMTKLYVERDAIGSKARQQRTA